jgi:hypothetical protein
VDFWAGFFDLFFCMAKNIYRAREKRKNVLEKKFWTVGKKFEF